MTNATSPDQYIGRNAVDQEGNKIGSIGQVYLDDNTGEPDWITVNTGLFGMKENFAPLAGSSFTGDDLVLPFDKTVVKDSPDIADASHLDADEQRSLYAYYQQYLGTGTGGYERTTTTGDAGYQRGAGRDTSGPNTDEAMTRSEEHLRVGTEKVEAGRARLRKYVVTEQQTVRVPVSHEEVRVDRVPITDANRDQRASGAELGEEEYAIVLHAERPVVTIESVPVERVRLDTGTVTREELVTGDVRNEQVDPADAEPPHTQEVDPVTFKSKMFGGHR